MTTKDASILYIQHSLKALSQTQAYFQFIIQPICYIESPDSGMNWYYKNLEFYRLFGLFNDEHLSDYKWQRLKKWNMRSFLF